MGNVLKKSNKAQATQPKAPEKSKPKKKGLVDRLLHSNTLVFTFLRSIVSSQTASIVDISLGFILFNWCGLNAFVATAVGASVGGAVNCIINYKFTFHAEDCPWGAVIIKYTMVWIGSLLLNAFGTDWLTTGFAHLGFSENWSYLSGRLVASLLVSWFWNFLLQRYFVFTPTRFDRYAEALMPKCLRKKTTQK